MATIQYVVNAVDAASATFERIAGSADKLNAELDEIGRKSVAARVGLEGDKAANLTLDKLDLKLAKLGKSVAEGKIGVEGQARAMLQIRALEVELDKLDRKHVDVTVDVDRHGLLGGGLGGLVGGGLAGLGRAVPGLGGLLSTPQAAIATIAAGLAALPFAATAAAGGIVTALGGGMTALGVIAAAKNKQVAKSFHDLAKQAGVDLRSISVPFQGVLKDIANQVQAQLPTIMSALGDAFKAAAGPLDAFGKTLVNSLASPSVLRAIRDLGGAFGAVLKALTPSLPSIINQIADGIDGIAQAIQAHPRIFADMINFLGHLVGWSLQAVGALTRVAAWLVQFTRDVGHWLRVAWDAFTGFFTTVHRSAVAFQDAMVASFRAFWHNVISVFDAIRHGIASAWNTIWSNTRNAVSSGINTVVGFFRGLPGRAVGAMFGLGHSMAAFMRAAWNEMWNAARNVAGSIWHWLTGWVQALPGWLKHLLGIRSPSSVFYDIGKNMMLGLFQGIKDHAHHARDAATSAIGDTGARSGNAAVAQSFARSVLPRGWSWPDLLALWNRESGWNAYAVNPSSGAYGIPQSLGHGHPYNLGDYKAQIMWGIRYIAGRYGNSQNAWAHEINFGWYDRGGWLPPGLSLALNTTGRPEPVGGGSVINIHVSVPPTVNPAQAGQQIAQLLLQHTKKGGRLYPQGVTPR